MAKRMMDKLKARIGVKDGAKNGPGSAPEEGRQVVAAGGAAQGEAAQAAQKNEKENLHRQGVQAQTRMDTGSSERTRGVGLIQYLSTLDPMVKMKRE